MAHIINTEFSTTVSHDIQPTTTIGATVTPGNNAWGNWATVIGTPITGDHHAIDICVHSIGSNGKATDSLTDIGIDPAGGTNYSTVISSLLSSYATQANNGQNGLNWFFPLLIPAGATIGARGSINNATVGTQLVLCNLRRAYKAHRWKFGTQVVAYGATLAASNGTAVTAGTTSNGSYTQIGSSIVSPPPWFWSVDSALVNTTAASAGASSTDIAVGSSTSVNNQLASQLESISSSETRTAWAKGVFGQSAVGDNVYARIWSATSQTAFSIIVHGVCG